MTAAVKFGTKMASPIMRRCLEALTSDKSKEPGRNPISPSSMSLEITESFSKS